MTKEMRRAGLALALVYAAVALVSHGLAPDRFRPLFDGFGPPTPYRWVNPPPEFARDNQQPDPAERDIPLTPEGNEVANVTTGDAQAIAALERGSVPAKEGETAVRVRLVPNDPATLGPIPAPLRVRTNAYLLTIAHQPSGTAVTILARVGTIALTAAFEGGDLLFSPDGRTWETIPSRPFGDSHGRFGELRRTGYYLVAGPPPFPAATSGTGTDAGPVLLVVLALLPPLWLALLIRGRHDAPARGKPRRPLRSGHAGRRT